jgi:DNA repair protein RadA/Sms
MSKKNTTVFFCNECGYESSKWLGKCPACGQWNTFVEEKIVSNNGTKGKTKSQNEVIKLNQVEKKESSRIKTDFEELDRVLGGGFVKGSLTLLRWRARNW